MTQVGQRTRSFVRVVAQRVALISIGTIAGIFVSRALQPEGRGVYYVAMTVAMTTAALGSLSIDKAHMTLWAGAENRAAVAGNSAWLGMSVGGLSALVAAAVVVGLGADVALASGYGVLALALVTVPFGLTGTYLGTVVTLRGRADLLERAELLAALVQYGVLILLAVAGWLSVTWVVGMWTLSTAMTTFILYADVRPRWRDRDVRVSRRAVSIGMRYHTCGVAFFLLQRADVLILSGLTTAVAVGLYSLAVGLTDMARLLTDAAAQAALAQQMEGDQDSTAAFTARTTRLTTMLALGSVASMCAAAPFVVPLIYGSQFRGSVAPLLALAPGLLVFGATRPIGSYQLRLGDPLLASALSAVALAVNVGLDFALIPLYGVVGCAIASTIGYGALAGLQVAWFLRTSGMSLRQLIPGGEEMRYLLSTTARLASSYRTG